MNKLKSISILLSIVLFLNVALLPISSYANVDESIYTEELTRSLENYVEPIVTVIYENENEKKYTVSTNDYVYHEKYVNVGGKRIIQTTTYTPDEKNVIDYYEYEIATSSLGSVGVTPRCGPPCGFIAVIAVRSVVSGLAQYTLRRTATSAILKTVKHAPPARIQGVIANYSQHNFTAGGKAFHINKNRMQHFLERHHTNYFNSHLSKAGNTQSFFVDSMDPRLLNHIGSQATQKNVSTILSSSKHFVQVDYTYNGIVYRVGVDKSFSPYLVTQIYPRTTFLLP